MFEKEVVEDFTEPDLTLTSESCLNLNYLSGGGDKSNNKNNNNKNSPSGGFPPIYICDTNSTQSSTQSSTKSSTINSSETQSSTNPVYRQTKSHQPTVSIATIMAQKRMSMINRQKK